MRAAASICNRFFGLGANVGSNRVIVFGYGELGVAAIEALASAGAHIQAVVVPSNRTGDDVEFIKSYARNHGLQLLIQPPRKTVEPFVGELRRIDPDLILVWSYPMILPRSVIEVPHLGSINVHGGLLPQYRGGHVMQWAIIKGESETGVAVHYMDEGIDTGPIVAQEHFPIESDDDALTVRQKLRVTGVRLLKAWWPAIAEGRAPRDKQDESKARYYPLRTSDDGVIDWGASSYDIHNLVRALVRPWPGAFTFVENEKLIVWKSRILPGQGESVPGVVAMVDQSGAYVHTGDSELVIEVAERGGSRLEGAQLRQILPVGVRLGA